MNGQLAVAEIFLETETRVEIAANAVRHFGRGCNAMYYKTNQPVTRLCA